MRTLIDLILSLFGGNKDKSTVQKLIEQLLLGKLTTQAGGDTTSPTPSGGVAGSALDILFEKFKNKGMGDVFGSWVSTGANKSVSPDQVKDAIGDDHMAEMAKESNMSVEDLAAKLSKYLPGVIDKLTPGGKLPGQ